MAHTWFPSTILLAASISCGPDATLRQRQAVDALRETLPPLQEAYYRRHGRYADQARFLLGGRDTLDSGIQLIVGAADSAGWTASASHRDFRGAACVTFRGDPAGRQGLRGSLGPELPGDIMCMDFRRWARNSQIVPALYDSGGTYLGPVRRRGGLPDEQ